MIEVVEATSLGDWDEAVHLTQANRALAAVYTVIDADDAVQALGPEISPTHFRGANSTGTLLFDRLPLEFSLAVQIAHNASHPEQITTPPHGRGVIANAYERGATGLHIDGDNDNPDYASPLTLLFISKRAVEVTLVPLLASDIANASADCWPKHLERVLTSSPGVDCMVPPASSLRFIPRKQADAVGRLVTLGAGQLMAVSSSGDTDNGRLPVGHQFVSLGQTRTERNSRTTSMIDTEDLAGA